MKQPATQPTPDRAEPAYVPSARDRDYDRPAAARRSFRIDRSV